MHCKDNDIRQTFQPNLGTACLGPDVQITRITISISCVQMAWLTQLASPSIHDPHVSEWDTWICSATFPQLYDGGCEVQGTTRAALVLFPRAA